MNTCPAGDKAGGKAGDKRARDTSPASAAAASAKQVTTAILHPIYLKLVTQQSNVTQCWIPYLLRAWVQHRQAGDGPRWQGVDASTIPHWHHFTVVSASQALQEWQAQGLVRMAAQPTDSTLGNLSLD